MTLNLTEQNAEDLILIQPYYSQKQQAKLIGVCTNTMMKIRDSLGLPKKDKGRPKGTGIVFKGEQTVPVVVEEAIQRLKKDIKIKKIRSSLRTEESRLYFDTEINNKTIEEIKQLAKTLKQKEK